MKTLNCYRLLTWFGSSSGLFHTRITRSVNKYLRYSNYYGCCVSFRHVLDTHLISMDVFVWLKYSLVLRELMGASSVVWHYTSTVHLSSRSNDLSPETISHRGWQLTNGDWTLKVSTHQCAIVVSWWSYNISLTLTLLHRTKMRWQNN